MEKKAKAEGKDGPLNPLESILEPFSSMPIEPGGVFSFTGGLSMLTEYALYATHPFFGYSALITVTCMCMQDLMRLLQCTSAGAICGGEDHREGGHWAAI